MKNVKIFISELVKWWMLHFRNTVVQKVEFDAYRVTFRRFTMDIETKSGNMKLRTMLMEHPQSFLTHCLLQNDVKVVEWFCNIVYRFVCLITTDQGLANDVQKAFSKYAKRMDKKAECEAKKITEDEDVVNNEIVNGYIEYSKKNKKERKAYKEAMRRELNEEDNE